MSVERCEHGNVVSDHFGVYRRAYRCLRCEPLELNELGGEDALELLRNLTPCDECGVVFKDRDAYGAHLCAGTQGR